MTLTGEKAIVIFRNSNVHNKGRMTSIGVILVINEKLDVFKRRGGDWGAGGSFPGGRTSLAGSRSGKQPAALPQVAPSH